MCRLTGLTRGQLRSWDRAGFFQPRYAYDDRSRPYSRVYSFRDVVGLKTISVLRNDHRVSVQELKKVAKELIRKGYKHWADTKLYVVKKQVYFQHPGTTEVEGVWDGQLAMLPIINVIDDVKAAVHKLSVRSSADRCKVERHKFVARNSPVVAGTRIPTASVRRYYEAGYSVDEIISEYPSLTKKDVRAALKYEEQLAKSA
ncbi:MAG: DUF433 domain-containing protein [Candidatus Phaeomarinobacter sp.]